MNKGIRSNARRAQCAKECRGLAVWLQDRALAIEDDITDEENTLAILDRYVGRIKSRIDHAGWVAGTRNENLVPAQDAQ
tara:strand:- start:470 stop:706 length:237 start_codon:yes stop_codon:yes gene_type:complete